jgi:hypothetical protein
MGKFSGVVVLPFKLHSAFGQADPQAVRKYKPKDCIGTPMAFESQVKSLKRHAIKPKLHMKNS